MKMSEGNGVKRPSTAIAPVGIAAITSEPSNFIPPTTRVSMGRLEAILERRVLVGISNSHVEEVSEGYREGLLGLMFMCSSSK